MYLRATRGEPFVGHVAAARPKLLTDGIVYVEVPDGEAALEAGYGRSEFYLDHYYVFSVASLDALARQAGFWPMQEVCVGLFVTAAHTTT